MTLSDRRTQSSWTVGLAPFRLAAEPGRHDRPPTFRVDDVGFRVARSGA